MKDLKFLEDYDEATTFPKHRRILLIEKFDKKTLREKEKIYYEILKQKIFEFVNVSLPKNIDIMEQRIKVLKIKKDGSKI